MFLLHYRCPDIFWWLQIRRMSWHTICAIWSSSWIDLAVLVLSYIFVVDIFHFCGHFATLNFQIFQEDFLLLDKVLQNLQISLISPPLKNNIINFLYFKFDLFLISDNLRNSFVSFHLYYNNKLYKQSEGYDQALEVHSALFDRWYISYGWLMNIEYFY